MRCGAQSVVGPPLSEVQATQGQKYDDRQYNNIVFCVPGLVLPPLWAQSQRKRVGEASVATLEGAVGSEPGSERPVGQAASAKTGARYPGWGIVAAGFVLFFFAYAASS